ncbi:hypothetical protein [Mesorhizobium sp.]|uniref:hypothetical protein n=1 Tax=Mesorhizobium sp. TaxID=1871066 RepID=UPI0025C58871|nr:hypothetical protein [Mesorhizobium sp.]
MARQLDGQTLEWKKTLGGAIKSKLVHSGCRGHEAFAAKTDAEVNVGDTSTG